MAVSALAVAVVAGPTEGFAIDWAPELVGATLWLGLVNSIGAFSLMFIMIRRGQAAQVARLFFLIPGVSALMGFVLLGERLAPLAMAGFVISALAVCAAAAKGVPFYYATYQRVDLSSNVELMLSTARTPAGELCAQAVRAPVEVDRLDQHQWAYLLNPASGAAAHDRARRAPSVALTLYCLHDPQNCPRDTGEPMALLWPTAAAPADSRERGLRSMGSHWTETDAGTSKASLPSTSSRRASGWKATATGRPSCMLRARARLSWVTTSRTVWV